MMQRFEFLPTMVLACDELLTESRIMGSIVFRPFHITSIMKTIVALKQSRNKTVGQC